MIILGIETSCDETAAAILKKEGDKITILSNVIASSASIQSKYGGIIPEQAAREQIKSIIPVIETAINDKRLTINDLDAIAVTYGPGLIGSLLVGVETAKVLASVWQKPLIPVNHLLGHFYANWINPPSSLRDHEMTKQSRLTGSPRLNARDDGFAIPQFPCIGLLVSGGHTDLVLFKNHNEFKYLGGTRDDAAGECFDKCARLLGLSYPGGPEISRLARLGNPNAYHLPRPMLNSHDFDFSYSGLKTAVSNLLSEKLRRTQKTGKSDNQTIRNSDSLSLSESFRNDLCASIQIAIIDPLVKKTLKAAKQFNVKTIILGGGVAANQQLKDNLKFEIGHLKLDISIHVPSPDLCTDNATMIASRAFFEKQIKNPLILQANPNLSLSF